MIKAAIYGTGEYSIALKILVDGLYNVYVNNHQQSETINVMAYIIEEKESFWDNQGIENVPVMGLEQLELFCREGLIDTVLVPQQIFSSDMALNKLNPNLFHLDNLYVADKNIFNTDELKLDDAKELFTKYKVVDKDNESLYTLDNPPLVTIYTQAYNSEPYIRQCIESVINQKYQNWEYFVCNHGSKDKTLDIMKEYEARDNRIKVIDMPNSVRGFYPDMIKDKGEGKYFAMLDSDDYWHEDNLERLVMYSEMNDLDMAVCGISWFRNTDDRYTVLRQCEKSYVYDIKDNEKYFEDIYKFLRTTWGKIIRMEVLCQADFTVYKENAKDFISDDTAFTMANYEMCRRIGAIPDILLYYRVTDGSVTASYKPKMIDNNENIHRQLLKVLENIRDESQRSHHFVSRIFWGAMYSACQMIAKSDMEVSKKIEEIYRIVSLDTMKQVLGISCVEREEFMKWSMSLIAGIVKENVAMKQEDMLRIKYISEFFDVYIAIKKG